MQRSIGCLYRRGCGVWVLLGVVIPTLLLLPPHIAMADALYAWGDNTSGEYGNGTTTSSLAPVAIASMSSGVTAIGGNQTTSLAVKNGAAYAWGTNVWGEVGNGGLTPTTVVTPYAIPTLSSGVTAVTGAYYASGAIRSGAVYGWGNNTDGEVGDGTTTNRYSPVAAQALGSGVTAIASGGDGTADHSLAIKNGAVYSWGNANNFGDSGTGSDATITTPVELGSLSSGVTAIAANQNNGAAIMNGALYDWGYNYYGTLGNGNYTEQDTPVAVPSMTSGVTGVALGRLFILVLKGGAVYGSGSNSSGQLGNATTITTDVPIQILPSSDSIIAVAASEGSAYALSSDGSIWDWGANSSGELGIGNTTEQTSPVQLLPPPGERFTAISAEAGSALALVAPVPEPASISLVAFAGLMMLRRQRRSGRAV